MAETPEKVSNFLSDLTQKMTPLGQEDLQCMLELKAEEVAKVSFYNILCHFTGCWLISTRYDFHSRFRHVNPVEITLSYIRVFTLTL